MYECTFGLKLERLLNEFLILISGVYTFFYLDKLSLCLCQRHKAAGINTVTEELLSSHFCMLYSM